jgi:hypothetical protein
LICASLVCLAILLLPSFNRRIILLTGPIPQFIGAELFKQGPRPAAMSFAGFINWLANMIVGISFPSIQVCNDVILQTPLLIVVVLILRHPEAQAIFPRGPQQFYARPVYLEDV